jgi:hypothetical protein
MSRGARTAEMLLTEARMRVNRPGDEPSGLLIGAGVKILGISLERRRRTPAALPLIADGNSVVWTARLLCFALFPLEGCKTSIVSIQTCHAPTVRQAEPGVLDATSTRTLDPPVWAPALPDDGPFQ